MILFLERVVERHQWTQVMAKSHAACTELVRRFYANFNGKISTKNSAYYHQNWVRGQWMEISLEGVNRYYSLEANQGQSALLKKMDYNLAAMLLYNFNTTLPKPLAKSLFKYKEFIAEYKALTRFVPDNIYPVSHKIIQLKSLSLLPGIHTHLSGDTASRSDPSFHFFPAQSRSSLTSSASSGSPARPLKMPLLTFWAFYSPPSPFLSAIRSLHPARSNKTIRVKPEVFSLP
ncbi:hypothetical protein Adt_03521 [Abeliophyllum distichum]|uniref:Uncharacterized protein n=1 Tax=Abeliophyllum distichum TaxID=126358 RepID=A0ABD1W0U7_9LAMI